MRGPDFEPEMVGREKELKELQAYLDKAAQGQGNTIFISGEAGIGKTRLADELKQIAQVKGFQVLSGNSLHESLTPYLPFIDALRSGGLENLFAEEAPRVEAVYLVTNAGILIKEVIRKETELNPDVFVSMFTTVTDFLNESLSKLSGAEEEGALNSLGYQNYRILIERCKDTNLVVIITGKENEFILNDMNEILYKITKTFERTLKEWGGDEKKVAGIEELLSPLITSGKYDGIYYGKDDPKIRRNLLFENISLGLMRQAQLTPTLLCIEDLQWADPSSLALIHYIARNTRKHSLLILGTYRPEDVAIADGQGHPLVQTKQLMDREDLWNELELQRLSEISIPIFLSRLLGEFDFSDEFSTRIYEETEGNPLFVLQLVKFLVEESIIKRDNGTWRLAKDPEDVIIPSKIYNVITRRLNRLDEWDMKIVDYASVIGEAFNSEILAHALNLKRIELLERLRILERTHRLIRPHDGNFRFDHAKIKEVAYDEIPEELKREYHSVVANSFETLNKGNMDKVIGNLAFHYYHSRNGEKALLYLRRAAEKAKREYSNEEALRFYSEALEFERESKKRLELLQVVGSIYVLIGDFETAMESYDSALELTEDKRAKAELKAKIGAVHSMIGEYDEAIHTSKDALELVNDEQCTGEALALHNLGRVHWARGEYERGLYHYRRSLEIREKIGDQQGIANCLLNIGTIYRHKGEYERALDHYRKSLEIREKIGDQRGIAASFNNIGIVHTHRGEYDRALEHYSRSLEIEERIGHQFGIANCLNNIGIVHRARGDYNRALDYYRKSLEIREKISDLRGIAGSFTNIGTVYSHKGEYYRTLENYGRSLEIKERIGDQQGIANCLNNIGSLHEDRGEYGRALEHYSRSLEIEERIGHQEGIANCLNNIGTAHENRGEYGRAIDYHMRTLEIREKIGDQGGLTRTYCHMAEAFLSMNDLEGALDFCNRAFNLSSEIGLKDSIAKSKIISGMIYREQELWEDSTENFEESIRLYRELGQKVDQGKSYYEFGLMWKQSGDTIKAEEVFNSAIKLFEEMKAEKDLALARNALRDLRRTPPPGIQSGEAT